MSRIFSTALSPDGYVAAGNYDGMLRIWRFRSGQSLEAWLAGQCLFCVVFTSDEGLLSGGDNLMRYWDVGSLLADQLASTGGAVDGGNIIEEKGLPFHGHTVRDSGTCSSLKLIFRLIGQCLFRFHLS